MARRWQVVSPEDAKVHPLYGVKNWLAVFAFGVLFGLLRELVTFAGEAHRADLTIGQLFAIDHPAVTFAKIALSLEVGVVAVIYWLLISKHQNFRQVATVLLLCSWPTAALIGLANPFPELANALATSVISWVLSCAIWVTYLQRSKRVRITFEHCVLSGETPSVEPTRWQPSFPAPSTTTPQFPGPTPRHTPSLRKPDVTQTTYSDPTKEMAAAQETAVPAEEFWLTALSEFDSPTRRPGLWARAFSEAQGVDSVAKASYLWYRAAELEQEHHAMLAERTRKAAQQAELEATRVFDREKEEARNVDELNKAIARGNIEAVRLLLLTGVDIRRRNGMGLSPLACAHAHERSEILLILQQYLAGRGET